MLCFSVVENDLALLVVDLQAGDPLADVRAALAAGNEIDGMVPSAVKKYIADNHLYG